MIGLDTNILIRLLVKDDTQQLELATRAIDEALVQDESLFVSDIVLCEVEWVLGSCYRANRNDILNAIEALTRQPSFVFENRSSLAQAIEIFRSSKCELSDCLIGAKAAANGARTVLTFDGALRRNPHFTVLR